MRAHGLTATAIWLLVFGLAACSSGGGEPPGDAPDGGASAGSGAPAGVCPDDLVPVNGECVERREPVALGPG
jgi:hypothetical protein